MHADICHRVFHIPIGNLIKTVLKSTDMPTNMSKHMTDESGILSLAACRQFVAHPDWYYSG